MKKKTINQIIKEIKEDVVLDAINDGISIQDINFKILYQNKKALDMFGDCAGEYCFKAYENRNNVCKGCPVFKAFKTGYTETTERAISTEKGKLYFEIAASPIRDNSGKIIAAIQIARNITDRKHTEEALLKAYEKLKHLEKERTTDLNQSNIALNVLLKQQDKIKTNLEDNILSNLKFLIMPHIKKLKKILAKSKDLLHLNIIESNINEITSSFSHNLLSKHTGLTPKEIQVANLVKEGRLDKEIMELLNISIDTVKTHRRNIRKKLGIYGNRTNLRTNLLSMLK